MPEPERRRERPLLSDHVEWFAEAATDVDPLARLELAYATAAALVDAGRGDAGPETSRLVALAETVGLDTLSELWRDAPPDSLPGALWALYLLRTWTERQGEAVARMYRAGRAYAPVDEVVAGVADDADPAAVRALADAVLTGAYRGEFDVARFGRPYPQILGHEMTGTIHKLGADISRDTAGQPLHEGDRVV